MTETERQDHDGGVLIRVRGDAPDEPTWSGKIEELLDDGCLAIVVDVSG